TMINCDRSITGKKNPVLYITRGQVILSVAEDPGAWEAEHDIRAAELANLRRHQAVMIIWVHQPTKLKLSQVSQALDTLGPGFCSRKGRQKHAGQDRNDRNDDQQLNKREGMSCPTCRLRQTATTMHPRFTSPCFHLCSASLC